MHLDLQTDEIDALLDALDCLKTKISFVKKVSYAEKTARLLDIEALEAKLRDAATSQSE